MEWDYAALLKEHMILTEPPGASSAIQNFQIKEVASFTNIAMWVLSARTFGTTERLSGKKILAIVSRIADTKAKVCETVIALTTVLQLARLPSVFSLMISGPN